VWSRNRKGSAADNSLQNSSIFGVARVSGEIYGGPQAPTFVHNLTARRLEKVVRRVSRRSLASES